MLEANEAFAEAWAGSRTWTGWAVLSADPAGRQAVRGPEAPHQPPVGPQTQPDFTSFKSGAAHSQEQLWVQPGTGGPCPCVGRHPSNCTKDTAPLQKTGPEGQVPGAGTPLGDTGHGKEPGPGQLTRQIVSWKAACLVPRTQPGSSSPSAPVTRGSAGSWEKHAGESGAKGRDLGCSSRSNGSADVPHPSPSQGISSHPPHPSRTTEPREGPGRSRARRDGTG